jgi:hypothetical protein
LIKYNGIPFKILLYHKVPKFRFSIRENQKEMGTARDDIGDLLAQRSRYGF